MTVTQQRLVSKKGEKTLLYCVKKRLINAGCFKVSELSNDMTVILLLTKIIVNMIEQPYM